MATINIGRVRPVYKGEWNATDTFVAFDFVLFSDETLYIALKDVPANYEPASQPDYWAKFGAKGLTGNGIKSFVFVEEQDGGNLWRMTFTDDRTVDILVPKGVKGDKGTGITSITFYEELPNGDYRYTITYDDATTSFIDSPRGPEMRIVRKPVVSIPNSSSISKFNFRVNISEFASLFNYPFSIRKVDVARDDRFTQLVVTVTIDAEDAEKNTVTINGQLLEYSTTYYVRVQDTNTMGDVSSYSDTVSGTTNAEIISIQKPTIISPAANSLIRPTTIPLTGSAFSSTGETTQDELTAVYAQAALDAGFTNLVYNSPRSATSVPTHLVQMPAQAQGKIVHARMKYEGKTGQQSEWGDGISFLVATVSTPTVLEPVNGAQNVIFRPILKASAWVDSGNVGVPTKSRYQVAKNATFTTIVWDSGEVDYTTQVTCGVVLDSLGVYYIRVMHYEPTFGWTNWSVGNSFTVMGANVVAYTGGIPTTHDLTCISINDQKTKVAFLLSYGVQAVQTAYIGIANIAVSGLTDVKLYSISYDNRGQEVSGLYFNPAGDRLLFIKSYTGDSTPKVFLYKVQNDNSLVPLAGSVVALGSDNYYNPHSCKFIDNNTFILTQDTAGTNMASVLYSIAGDTLQRVGIKSIFFKSIGSSFHTLWYTTIRNITFSDGTTAYIMAGQDFYSSSYGYYYCGLAILSLDASRHWKIEEAGYLSINKDLGIGSSTHSAGYTDCCSIVMAGRLPMILAIGQVGNSVNGYSSTRPIINTFSCSSTSVSLLHTYYYENSWGRVFACYTIDKNRVAIAMEKGTIFEAARGPYGIFIVDVDISGKLVPVKFYETNMLSADYSKFSLIDIKPFSFGGSDYITLVSCIDGVVYLTKLDTSMRTVEVAAGTNLFLREAAIPNFLEVSGVWNNNNDVVDTTFANIPLSTPADPSIALVSSSFTTKNF